MVSSVVDVISGALSYFSQPSKKDFEDNQKVKVESLRWKCGYLFEDFNKPYQNVKRNLSLSPRKTSNEFDFPQATENILIEQENYLNSQPEPCMSRECSESQLVPFSSITNPVDKPKTDLKHSYSKSSDAVKVSLQNLFSMMDASNKKEEQFHEIKNLPSTDTTSSYNEFIKENENIKSYLRKNTETVYQLNDGVSRNSMSPHSLKESKTLTQTFENEVCYKASTPISKIMMDGTSKSLEEIHLIKDMPSSDTIHSFSEFVKENEVRKRLFRQNMETVYQLSSRLSQKLMSPHPLKEFKALTEIFENEVCQKASVPISKTTLPRGASKFMNEEDIVPGGIRGGESNAKCCVRIREFLTSNRTEYSTSSFASSTDRSEFLSIENPRLEGYLKEFIEFQHSWDCDKNNVFSMEFHDSPGMVRREMLCDQDDFSVYSCPDLMKEHVETDEYQPVHSVRLDSCFNNDKDVHGIAKNLYRKLTLLGDCFQYVYYQMDGIDIKLFRSEEISKKLRCDLQVEKDNLRQKESIYEKWSSVREKMQATIVNLRHQICKLRAKKGHICQQKAKVELDIATLEKGIASLNSIDLNNGSILENICVEEEKLRAMRMEKIKLEQQIFNENVKNQNKMAVLCEIQESITRCTMKYVAGNPTYRCLMKELSDYPSEVENMKRSEIKHRELKEGKIRLTNKLIESVKRMETTVAKRKGSIVKYNKLALENNEELEEMLKELTEKSQPKFQLLEDINRTIKELGCSLTKVAYCGDTYQKYISMEKRAKLEFCNEISTSLQFEKYYKISGDFRTNTRDGLSQELDFLKKRIKEMKSNKDAKKYPDLKKVFEENLKEQRQTLLNCIDTLKYYARK